MASTSLTSTRKNQWGQSNQKLRLYWLLLSVIYRDVKNMIIRRSASLLIGLLLLAWGLYNLYGMVIINHAYTLPLTALVSGMAVLSLLSGIGILWKKYWGFSAYIIFSSIFLLLMIYTRNFLTESTSPVEFGIVLLSVFCIFGLCGFILKKEL